MLASAGIPWVGFRKEGLIRAEFRERSAVLISIQPGHRYA